MSHDLTSGRAASPSAPADRLAPVTPSDAADLPGGLCRGLYVGGGGDVVVRDRFGTQATLASGDFQYHPVRIARVLAAGTTATRIVALY